MEFQVHVAIPPASTPPESGLPVQIEVRDTGVQDAAAIRLATASGSTLPPDTAGVIASLPVTVSDADLTNGSLTVFARVATAPTDHVSLGDYITQQSYPLTAASGEVRVEVKRVG